MSSEAEKREREARGPHKESVDIYGETVAGVQHIISVTPEGKVRCQMYAYDVNGNQVAILVTPQGKTASEMYGQDEDGVQHVILLSADGKVLARTEMLIQSEYDYDPIVRDADGRITQIVVTDGVMTKTYDIVRDANGRIQSIDQTVV